MSTPTALLFRAQEKRRSTRTRSLKAWYRNPSLVAGLIVVGALVLVAVLAPVIAPFDPVKQDLQNSLLAPGGAHVLGTDKYGRDVLSRLIWGAQVDLRIGFMAVLIPFVFGSVVGALAGYFGGWFDSIVMQIVDIFFAFPFYVMVIVLVAKKQDYIVAARLGGMSHGRVIVRHIGPNVMSQAIIYAMSDIVLDIMAIVTLGYLGLGVAPPTAEWGSMILDGQEFITTQWQQATIPGLVIVVTSLGLSWIGDGLSDLLSPERRK
jgi:peptide/nickel transport system permease protein